MTLGHGTLDGCGLSIGDVARVLDHMAAMRGRQGGRGDQVPEDEIIIGDQGQAFDPDFDFDSDLERETKEPQPSVAGAPLTACLNASVGTWPVPLVSEMLLGSGIEPRGGKSTLKVSAAMRPGGGCP